MKPSKVPTPRTVEEISGGNRVDDTKPNAIACVDG